MASKISLGSFYGISIYGFQDFYGNNRKMLLGISDFKQDLFGFPSKISACCRPLDFSAVLEAPPSIIALYTKSQSFNLYIIRISTQQTCCHSNTKRMLCCQEIRKPGGLSYTNIFVVSLLLGAKQTTL